MCSVVTGLDPSLPGWKAGPLSKLVKAAAGLGKGWELVGGAKRGSRIETGLEHPGHCQGEGTGERVQAKGSTSFLPLTAHLKSEGFVTQHSWTAMNHHTNRSY